MDGMEEKTFNFGFRQEIFSVIGASLQKLDAGDFFWIKPHFA